MFRKHSTAAQKPPTPAPSPPRPEASSDSSSSTYGQTWKIDQDLITRGLQLLPTVLTPQNKLDYLTMCAVETAETGSEWLDFDYCTYLLGIVLNVFSKEKSLDFYKWVFWTDNALNTRLSSLITSMGFQFRSFPDYQLRCVDSTKPILSGSAIQTKQCVIAIDFGSTHSGFAYALTTRPPFTVHVGWQQRHSSNRHRNNSHFKGPDQMHGSPSLNGTSANGSSAPNNVNNSSNNSKDHQPDKQPTAALFDKNLKLVCFGQDARDFFMKSLAGDLLLNKFTQSGNDFNFARDYLYFDGDIKMRLWGSSNAKLEELEARTCQTLGGSGSAPLLDIVAKILDHIKQEALDEVNALIIREHQQQLATLTPGQELPSPAKLTASNALWVLTVPAIWKEPDKHFMRKAAYKAGMINDVASSDLILALEPECAALAARYASSASHSTNPQSELNLSAGQKLLTFDCGGGTVDVCAIEILSDYDPLTATPTMDRRASQKNVNKRFTCKQLLYPTGGDWGGKKVDDAFYKFFEKFFGQAILERCRVVNPAALIELMEQWERLKTSLTIQDFLSGTSAFVDLVGDKDGLGSAVFATNQGRGTSSATTASPGNGGSTLGFSLASLGVGKNRSASTTSNQATTAPTSPRRAGSNAFAHFSAAPSVQQPNNSNQISTSKKKIIDVSHVLREAGNGPEAKLASLVKRYNATQPDKDKHVSCRAETMLGEPTLLKLPTSLIVSFFDPVLDSIVEHCRFLLREFPRELQGLKQILLVGGMGSCPLLKFKFERAFPGMTILTSPTRGGALVEFGAVKFGMQPSVFRSRRSKLTLGVKTTMEYHSTIHRGKLYRENKFFDRKTKKHYIRNVFQPFLVAGQEVEQDQTIVHRFSPPHAESDKVKFDIYTCDDRAPVEFITEDGCRLLCRIVVPVKKGEMPLMECCLKVGFTEISAEVKKVGSDEIVMRRVLFEFHPDDPNSQASRQSVKLDEDLMGDFEVDFPLAENNDD